MFNDQIDELRLTTDLHNVSLESAIIAVEPGRKPVALVTSACQQTVGIAKTLLKNGYSKFLPEGHRIDENLSKEQWYIETRSNY